MCFVHYQNWEVSGSNEPHNQWVSPLSPEGRTSKQITIF